MKDRSSAAVTVRYAALQGILWANVAAISGYLNPYLQDRGLSVTEIGLLIALSSAGGALLQPVTGALADRPGKPTLKQIMLAILGVFAVLCAGVALLHRAGGMALGVMLCLSLLTWQLLTPLVNAAGLSNPLLEGRLNYPVARGVGSITYAIVFFTLGQVITGRTWLIPAAMPVLLLLMLAAVLRNPMTESRGAQARGEGSAFLFLLRYPRYCVVLLGSFGALIGHGVVNHFAIQIVNAHGGAEPDMGAAIALACLMELPVMFGFTLLRKRFTAMQMLVASTIAFLLKVVVTWVTATMTGFYLAQLFQMPGFALYAVSSVLFISQEMEPGDQVKGQTWCAMATAAATILGSAVGGWLFDSRGLDALMRFAAITSAVGALAMAAAVKVPHRRGERRTPPD